MPLIDAIRRRLRTSGPNPLFQGDTGWVGRSTWGSLTDDQALGLTAVFRAVQLTATTVASLPLDIFEKRGQSSVPAQGPQNAYLWYRPNREMTRQTFWENVVGHEVMGDGFIFVEKNRDETPLALWPLESSKVRVIRASGTKFYEYTNGTSTPNVYKDFLAGEPNTGEIIHVPNWSRGNLVGMNPIKVASAALKLGMTAQEYAESLFAEGAVPQGVLKSDQVITDAQAEILQRRWETRHKKGGRVAVLGSGTDFKETTISPVDAQLIEQMNFSLGDVERLFGVPAVLLADTDRTTSWGSGIEMLVLGWYQTTLQGHITRFEQAIDHALLRRLETRRFCKFNVDGLLRGTPLARAQKHTLAYSRWMTVNEIRALEDLPPIDGGDVVLAGTSLTPLEALEMVRATGQQEPADQPGLGEPVANIAKSNGHHAMKT